jgi:hypothetical protein
MCEQPDLCGTGQCVDTANNYRCSCPNVSATLSVNESRLGDRSIDWLMDRWIDCLIDWFLFFSRQGYEYVKGTCVAVNQCALLNPCGPGATCQDLGGRYSCLCPKGFGFDDLTCVGELRKWRNFCLKFLWNWIFSSQILTNASEIHAALARVSVLIREGATPAIVNQDIGSTEEPARTLTNASPKRILVNRDSALICPEAFLASVHLDTKSWMDRSAYVRICL